MICVKLEVTIVLKRAVSLTSISWTLNKFQSFRMLLNKELKKSSNASCKLSLILMMWLRSYNLCDRRPSLILRFTCSSLALICETEVLISSWMVFSKSSLSTELRGTTGCSKWVELRQRAQTGSWHFKQNRISWSPWHWHSLIGWYQEVVG